MSDPARGMRLPGFTERRVATAPGVEILVGVAGSGPPVLLLHGYPQTHLMWRHVAPLLARSRTVVVTDLRGYGGSTAPPDEPQHAQMSFRAMARDQLLVMEALGHERFAVVGHDRGGRTAHRLALDHPAHVERLAVLDILPTLAMYEATDAAFAMSYWHWFLLPQPDLPELLLGPDPAGWLGHQLAAQRASGAIDDEVFAAYVDAMRDPASLHATVEDYRAAATIDLEHDRADRDAGRRVACPLLALWGAANPVWQGADLLPVWRAYADDVRGAALPCGHYLPEELPEETLRRLVDFLDG